MNLLFYVSVAVVGFAAGMAVHTIRAKPGPAPHPTYHRVADAWCHEAGRDCVDNMRQAGYYCGWAAEMAVYGARYRHEAGQSLDETLRRITPQMRRPMTAQEVRHARFWLEYGWRVSGERNELQVRGMALRACHEGAPA